MNTTKVQVYLLPKQVMKTCITLKHFVSPLKCIQAVNTMVVVNDDFKEYAYLLAFCQEVQSIASELL